MQYTASVLENETHKILCDFNIQMDRLVQSSPVQKTGSSSHKQEAKIIPTKEKFAFYIYLFANA